MGEGCAAATDSVRQADFLLRVHSVSARRYLRRGAHLHFAHAEAASDCGCLKTHGFVSTPLMSTFKVCYHIRRRPAARRVRRRRAAVPQARESLLEHTVVSIPSVAATLAHMLTLDDDSAGDPCAVEALRRTSHSLRTCMATALVDALHDESSRSAAKYSRKARCSAIHLFTHGRVPAHVAAVAMRQFNRAEYADGGAVFVAFALPAWVHTGMVARIHIRYVDGREVVNVLLCERGTRTRAMAAVLPDVRAKVMLPSRPVEMLISEALVLLNGEHCMYLFASTHPSADSTDSVTPTLRMQVSFANALRMNSTMHRGDAYAVHWSPINDWPLADMDLDTRPDVPWLPSAEPEWVLCRDIDPLAWQALTKEQFLAPPYSSASTLIEALSGSPHPRISVTLKFLSPEGNGATRAMHMAGFTPANALSISFIPPLIPDFAVAALPPHCTLSMLGRDNCLLLAPSTSRRWFLAFAMPAGSTIGMECAGIETTVPQ